MIGSQRSSMQPQQRDRTQQQQQYNSSKSLPIFFYLFLYLYRFVLLIFRSILINNTIIHLFEYFYTPPTAFICLFVNEKKICFLHKISMLHHFKLIRIFKCTPKITSSHQTNKQKFHQQKKFSPKIFLIGEFGEIYFFLLWNYFYTFSDKIGYFCVCI